MEKRKTKSKKPVIKENSPQEYSVNFYRSAIEDTPALINRFQPDGTIIFANKSYCDFFGFSKKDFGKKKIFDNIPPERHAEARKNISLLTKNEPIHDAENLVIRKNGEQRWIRWTDRALFDEKGNIYAYQSMGVDITTEKNIQLENIEILKNLNKAQRLAHIGSWEWNLITGEEKWSEELFRITGRDPANGIPSYEEYVDQCHPDDKDYIHNLLDKAKEGNPYQTEIRFFRHNDGQERNLRIIGELISGEDGIPYRHFATIIDITNEVKANEKIRESESRFRAFMDNFPANAYIKDDQLRHIFVNRSASEFIGIPQEEFIGKKTSDVYPEDLASELEEFDQQVLDDQIIIEKEGFYFPPGGKKRYQRDIKFPLIGQDGERLVGGIALDLSAQKEAEQQLIKQAKFEQMLTQISSGFLDIPAEKFDAAVQDAFEKIGELLGLDRINIGYIAPNANSMIVSHIWSRRSRNKQKHNFQFNAPPHLINLFRQGETIVWPDYGNHPSERSASAENYFAKAGIKSFAGIPIHFTDTREGGISFFNLTEVGIFTPDLIERLQLFAQLIGNAISLNETQKTVRVSEAKYRSVVEDTPILINRFLPDGTITFTNQSYIEFFGEAKDSLIGSNFLDLLQLKDRKDVLKRIGNLTPDVPIYEIERQETRSDDEIRWLRWTVRGLFDDRRNLVSVQSFGIDINEAKELQQALRKERDKARSYLTLVQTIVIALDHSGEITLANPKACEVLGYSEDELIGKNWFDTCLPEESISEVKNVLDQCIKGKTKSVEYYENPIISKSGEQRIIAWHNIDLIDDNGEIFGILSSGEDITDLKEAEKRMHTLLDISSKVTHESIEQNPLQTVADQILEKIEPAQAVTIWLYDEEHDQLSVKAMAGYEGPGIMGLAVDAGLGVIGQVFDHKKPIIRNDVSSDPMFSDFGGLTPENEQIKCLMCAPLIYQEKIYGVLSVDNLDTINAFIEDDLILLESIANQLSGVIENTALFTEVQKNREELRALSSRLLKVHEDERKLIAMDLHDHFGQILTTLKLSLRADSFIRQNEKEQRERLGEVSSIVDELLEAAEDLSLRLRPAILDDLGIEPAFQWHIDRFTRQTGIPTTVNIDLVKGRRYPGDVEITLYRALEECLTNAARHGAPSKIEVTLIETNRILNLRIFDDGTGFDVSDTGNQSYEHTGITGLRERLKILSGTYDIQSKKGKGTTIQVTLPVENNSGNHV